jgi:hypothetical protein
MKSLNKLLITLALSTFVPLVMAQINIGAIGDSMTDEYLLPNPAGNQYHTNLAAHSWLEILAQTRSGDFNFGPYAAIDGTPWPDERDFGYEYNWAKVGGAASRGSIIEVGSWDFAIDTLGSSYGDTMATGLASYITAGDVQFAYVGLGSNDFFYLSRNFTLSGADVAKPGFDGSDTVWQDTASTEVSSAILAHVDILLGAGAVNIIVAELPMGTAAIRSGEDPDPGVLVAIDQTNTKLRAGLLNRSIPAGAFIDLFAWNTDPVRQKPNGTVIVGGLNIPAGSTATDPEDLAPDGFGPCNSFGDCATLSHTQNFSAEDGLHPNTLIQALFANEIIAALNSVYGQSIETLSDDEMLAIISDDLDQDGVLNNAPDNCLVDFNPLQEDDDTDGVGNVCELPPGCGG